MLANPKRVLLIDDEPDFVMVVGTRLELNGFLFVSAGDDQEGLKKAVEYKPDIILLDLHISNVDGAEVCRNLKKNPDTSHIPVILLSAVSEEEIKKISQDCGADGFLAKPFNSVDLVAKVKSILCPE